MKISVSSYSYSSYLTQGHTILDVVDKAHEMGFSAMEFIDIPGDDFSARKEKAKEVKERLDSYGMGVTAYTIGADMYKKGEDFNNQFDILKNQLDIASILGAPLMRHDATYQKPVFGNGLMSFDNMLPVMAENTRTVTEYAKTLGIKTCVENHGYVVQDAERLERYFNAVNHENFGLLVDMGNFLCADSDPILSVSRLAPYAIHVHAKDMIFYSGEGHNPGGGCFPTRGGNWLRGTVIGQGSVPVKQCLRALRFAGYAGNLGIEFEGCEDPIESIDRGHINLKKYLEQLDNE
ncbi:MAG: sugar phosphate isomerase/epimerase [Clostridia bacterium]|nr:sugar phosphate isomerase/epimerase [Clostridia bacterium]